MEIEPGKLFVGGISWDTNEERLREYFETFGEVMEAVIMKDRATGRARGFGFVVFSDAATAERVVMEKHVIDGRTVEAKKAVPRDDQNTLNRNNNGMHGSPGPVRTKKIFVGGLASTVTESDFKKYFDQFGTITDVVVMYDHNTQRPRGFGFITYDSEEAVEKVLQKVFHELNGKMVEVKRAVPKELSPGPSKTQVGGYNLGLSRVSSFLNGYTQGYNPNSVGGFGVRMDGRYSPVTVGRSAFSPIGPNFSMGVNFEPGMSPSFGGNGNLGSNLGYGRESSPLYSGSSNKFVSPIGYGVGHGGNGSLLSSPIRNMWGNGSLNYATNSANSNTLMDSGNGNLGMGSFGNIGAIWGSSPSSNQGGGVGSAYSTGNFGYGTGDVNSGSGSGVYGRSIGTNAFPNAGYDGADRDSYETGSVYGNLTWRSSPSGLDRSNSFGYGHGNAASDVMDKSSLGYVGGYSRQANRGIAA